MPSWVFLRVKGFAEGEILSNAKSSDRFEPEATAVKRTRRSDAEGGGSRLRGDLLHKERRG